MLNKVLNKYCHEENISVINHNYINSTRHLNRRKLHFNNYGNSVFVKNIINFLSNLIWRDSRDNSGYKQNSPSLSISTLNSLDISESSNIYENDLHKIKVQCLEHFNTLIVGHLNINSIRNKFQMVAETANVKIICIEFHLKHRLRIFLFRRKIMFRSQDIQVFVFLTIPWFTKSVTSRWVLVHETRCIFEYIFWTTNHEATKLGQLIDISKYNNSQ